jgi:hypothetical protein
MLELVDEVLNGMFQDFPGTPRLKVDTPAAIGSPANS